MANAISVSTTPIPAVLEREEELSDWLEFCDLLSRNQSLSRHVCIPQLIVCGGQSSGKSALLEGISGVPLPSKLTACTRFPTQIAIRKAASWKTTARIILHGDEADANRRAKEWYIESGEPLNLQQIKKMMEGATQAMGMSSEEFSRHVLRLEIHGPNLKPMDLVDLPGLYATAGAGQSRANIEFIRTLVHEYIANPSNIVLVVVRAERDFNVCLGPDIVLDVEGAKDRCLGVITHPDLAENDEEVEGYEELRSTWLSLATNKDSVNRYGHGWHVVRNRLGQQKSFTRAVFNVKEQELIGNTFFKDVPDECKTLDNLTLKVQDILLRLFRDSAPRIKRELGAAHDASSRELARLQQDRARLSNGHGILGLAEKLRDVLKQACVPASNLSTRLAKEFELFRARIRSRQTYHIFAGDITDPHDPAIGNLCGTDEHLSQAILIISKELDKHGVVAIPSIDDLFTAAKTLLADQWAGWLLSIAKLRAGVMSVLEKGLQAAFEQVGLDHDSGSGKIVWESLVAGRIKEFGRAQDTRAEAIIAKMQTDARNAIVDPPRAILEAAGRAMLFRHGSQEPNRCVDFARVLVICEVLYRRSLGQLLHSLQKEYVPDRLVQELPHWFNSSDAANLLAANPALASVTSEEAHELDNEIDASRETLQDLSQLQARLHKLLPLNIPNTPMSQLTVETPSSSRKRPASPENELTMQKRNKARRQRDDLGDDVIMDEVLSTVHTPSQSTEEDDVTSSPDISDSELEYLQKHEGPSQFRILQRRLELN